VAILDLCKICRFIFFGSPKDFHNFLRIGEYRSFFLSIKEYKDNFGSKQWDNISKHRANAAKFFICALLVIFNNVIQPRRREIAAALFQSRPLLIIPLRGCGFRTGLSSGGCGSR
jgi:hypothetical protein